MLSLGVLQTLAERRCPVVSHCEVRGIDCFVLSRESNDAARVRVKMPLFSLCHVSHFWILLMFTELNGSVQSLEGFVIVIYLVVANSESVGRQLLASFRSGRLRFVVLANDADLAYCHRLVPTSRTHKAIEGYIWKHKLLILGFGFSFRTLFSLPRVLSRDVRSRWPKVVHLVIVRIWVRLVHSLVDDLLVLWCDFEVLQCLG